MSQQRLTILCDLAPGIGYGQHAMQMVRWLDKLGVYASVRPLSENEEFDAEVPLDIRARIVRGPQPEPWEITIAPPGHKPTPGKRSVYFTMYEATVLPGYGVESLNMADLVIVPCEWNREIFIRSGVKAPIFVVPLGFDAAWYYPRKTYAPSETTLFAAGGRTAHGRERKGLDAVIRSFLAAFPYDKSVQLQIKCYPDCKLVDIKDRRIVLFREHWEESAVATWLADQHCFVSAACGEGFGLWQLQALASGVPLISVAYGGLREFAGPHNAYLIHYREVPSSEHFGGLWAQPDLGTLISQMRHVHAHREEAKQLGFFAAETVKGLTWENSARQLLAVLAMAGAVKTPRAAFHKPVIHQIDCSPPAQESLVAQAHRQGFTLEELRFQKREGEAVFNPSVALIKGELLWFARRSKMTNGDRPDSRIFAFREADALTGVLPFAQRIPVYLPQIFQDAFEDPRAQATEDGISLSYSRVSKWHPACQEMVLLDCEFNVREVFHMDHAGNGRTSTTNTKTQKNWVWFQCNGSWHCIYWLEPMTVIQTIAGQRLRTFTTDNHYAGWKHGVRHGGGPPTQIGGEFFGFCHSLLPWYSQTRSRYFLSAYAFSAKPPFAMTRLSREPFLASVDDVSSNPCSCVICGGAVHQDGQWTLAVGAKDGECYKLTLSHEWLLGTMEKL